jgi:hypothetical protein
VAGYIVQHEAKSRPGLWAKIVCYFAHTAPTFSEVGASGTSGAVQPVFDLHHIDEKCRNLICAITPCGGALVLFFYFFAAEPTSSVTITLVICDNVRNLKISLGLNNVGF